MRLEHTTNDYILDPRSDPYLGYEEQRYPDDCRDDVRRDAAVPEADQQDVQSLDDAVEIGTKRKYHSQDQPLCVKLTNPDFKRRKTKFFKPGTVSWPATLTAWRGLTIDQVLQCILNQESGISDAATATEAPSIRNIHGVVIYTEVRMFVVMYDNNDFSSTCL
jgi:hypothetical protein